MIRQVLLRHGPRFPEGHHDFAETTYAAAEELIAIGARSRIYESELEPSTSLSAANQLLSLLTIQEGLHCKLDLHAIFTSLAERNVARAAHGWLAGKAALDGEMAPYESILMTGLFDKSVTDALIFADTTMSPRNLDAAITFLIRRCAADKAV